MQVGGRDIQHDPSPSTRAAVPRRCLYVRVLYLPRHIPPRQRGATARWPLGPHRIRPLLGGAPHPGRQRRRRRCPWSPLALNDMRSRRFINVLCMLGCPVLRQA